MIRALRILQYIFFVVLDISWTLICLLLINWWAPFLAVKGTPYIASVRGQSDYTNCQMLPQWLKWADTFDVTLDAGWVDRYWPNTYTAEAPPPYWVRKWYQIKWLYRNPGYGFSYWVEGIPFSSADWTFSYTKTATLELWVATSVHGHFNINYTGFWGTYKLGWKAWNYFDPVTRAWAPGYMFGPVMRTPFAFTPIPFKH
jgi:hypothetical protein